MATITKKNLRNERSHAGAFGNRWSQIYSFDTNSSGYFLDSDTPAAAVGITDVVRLGIIPAGVRLSDAMVIISDASAASVTYKLGFAYVDGVDVTAVPQDDDYFVVAGTAASTAIRQVANNTAVRPVTLPKDAYLIWTNAGAAHSATMNVDVVVQGTMVGV